MNYNPKFLEELKEYDPKFYEAVSNVVETAYVGGALDQRTKLLIALSLDAISASKGGVTSLSKKAKAAGATDEEIRETLRLAYYISGMKVIQAATGVLE